MLDIDLLIVFIFMGLLFLRQIFILKQPNKINYGPLMLGIGAIGSIIHFIAHPDAVDFVLLLKESMFPVLVALLFFVIINILHQNQESEIAKTQQEFTKVLVSQVTQLKEYMAELESRIIVTQQEDKKVQEDTKEKLRKDIKSLEAIQLNQIKFLEKFDEMNRWHEAVSKAIEYFRDVQLPEFDNVVHKHIDILRVSEEEHYRYVKLMLDKEVGADENMEALTQGLNNLKNISNDISNDITSQTNQKLENVTNSFQEQIISLKSHAEGVKTSLYEGESRLGAIREQSEIVMKQMVLSSNKMGEMESQYNSFDSVYVTVKNLIEDIKVVKADYDKSQIQLNITVKEFKNSETQQIVAMKNQIEFLGETLTRKIEDSLKELHEHYHLTSESITQSVQTLNKKIQFQKGYSQSDIIS